jgi:hypothetical protein
MPPPPNESRRTSNFQRLANPMYHFEFEGSPRQVGRVLNTLSQLEAKELYWVALGQAMMSAVHYPLDARLDSAQRIANEAYRLVSESSTLKKATVSPSSDMVRFNLSEAEYVSLRLSASRHGDLAVVSYLHPSRLCLLVAVLSDENLKFGASPTVDPNKASRRSREGGDILA